METTFITIHNLTSEANILYASDSIVDILGFHPAEVTGKSCFDYFHPDEIPFARRVHSYGVQLDKAASLHYARVMNREGVWVACECVFTIVYEVLVACTSIYKGDAKNERRALEAPNIRRLFASSPRDPRYHMLEHLSAKFRAPPQASLLEPRAALILNRFTRTLSVMYSTNAVSDILGLSATQLQDKSFYECMQENCLPDAIRCLESAKANDSIAYLRFWYRDPRTQEERDEAMREASISSDSEDGGVELTPMEIDSTSQDDVKSFATSVQDNSSGDQARPEMVRPEHNFRTSSGESTDLEQDSSHTMFDRPAQRSRSSTSSSSEVILSSGGRRGRRSVTSQPAPPEAYEIEAVVSCTSDGLVVVLRRARPMIPSIQQPNVVSQFAQGLFAAPWGVNPIRPHVHQFNPQYPFRHGLHAPQLPMGGPPIDQFMESIREVAVFAWSLTGINGNIAAYGHGTPRGEALPPGGLPIWDPYSQPTVGYMSPENQAAQRWARYSEKTKGPEENMVPYQHYHQEDSLRRHHSYGQGPMGSDRMASMGQGSAMGQAAYSHLGQVQAQQQHSTISHNQQGGWPNIIQPNVGNYVPPPERRLDGDTKKENRRYW